MKWMSGLIVLAVASSILFPGATPAQETPATASFNLSSLIRYAMKHNPALKMAQRNVEIEDQGLKAARAERMPRIDVTGGYSRYRYPAPLTPIVITGPPLTSVDFPDFEKNVYDGFATFSIPLFKGGRLMRGVTIAGLKRSMAQDFHTRNLHELTYNVTAVYYKLAQFDELLRACDAQVKGLQSHRRDVESSLRAGTVPMLDLLKADTELGAAMERRIQTRNSITNTTELLRSIIGMDDPGELVIVFNDMPFGNGAVMNASLEGALAARPDYKAALSKVKMFEERIASARGKRLPDIYGAGDYGGKAGDRMSFRENWSVGVRLLLPVFDFGRIDAEIDRERLEFMKAREEERALRLSIARELKEARSSIVNADERIAVSEKAVLSAKEQARIEDLRYRSGDNTSTDVINAEAALIRARADHCQARFDRHTAVAALEMAMGSTNKPADTPPGGRGSQATPAAPTRSMTEDTK
ncbi:MAG: TolC family protein [Syntrophorhabdaceae bacterium]|nr:TolC family protein [Syntrophorhabdaceae bacterium]